MSKEISVTPINKFELALINGDLSKLEDNERLSYVSELCKSLGLNPLTKPFEYIVLQGKMTLYATKSATEQLRALHKVSIEKLESKQIGDVFLITATAKTPDGRTDTSTGAVSLKSPQGNALSADALANALMKAETKAKRRVTLSICGLGFLDESELESIKDKKFVRQELPKHDEKALKSELNALLDKYKLSDATHKKAFFEKMNFNNLDKLSKALQDEDYIREQIVSFAQNLEDKKEQEKENLVLESEEAK